MMVILSASRAVLVYFSFIGANHPSLEATLLLRRVDQQVLWHNELALLEEPLEPKGQSN